MKFKILTAMILALGLGLSASAAAERIAYVDIAEIFDQYEGTATAKEQLKQEADKEKGKLAKQKDKLEAEIESLQSKQSVMTKEKYKQKEDELRKRTAALQQEIQEISNQLIIKEKNLTKNIVDEIKAIVAEVAEDEKYDLIFEKNAVMYGGKDITYLVIKRMNRK